MKKAPGNRHSAEQAKTTCRFEVEIDLRYDDVITLAVAVCIDEMAHGGR